MYGLRSKLIDAILLNELNTNLIYSSLDTPEIFLDEVKKLVCPQHEMSIWIFIIYFVACLLILLPFQAFQITALDILKAVYFKEVHQLANRQGEQLRLVHIVYQRHTGKLVLVLGEHSEELHSKSKSKSNNRNANI